MMVRDSPSPLGAWTETSPKDPKTPPFLSSAYNIRGDAQREALERNIQKYLDMGIIEYGTAE